ncbi:hypothetical protein [Hyperthermus butylicus]|uniref:SIS domain-containing protein n=1 Tax=Hyperthermus butylicus (strain DSM 5456 / JCM 9403 / PLM1-5) TaxID=415426 RepID=A2BIU3_HYPBU|nr:hypothetical protein [Hyperthermus butylicus]ABM79899.1 hypothetical protein Hbut_0021 [Hyperthermus butylicus DSM 5456]
MLQLTRDSTPLTREKLKRLEKQAEELAKRIFSFLNQSYSELYLTYAGTRYALAAATLGYWVLRQITTTSVRLEPIEALIYHIVAYREENIAVILFAEAGAENIVGRAIDATKLTGVSLVAVTPPLPPVLKARAPSEESIGRSCIRENPPHICSCSCQALRKTRQKT